MLKKPESVQDDAKEQLRAPTLLSQEDVDEFKRIMKKECGEELSNSEAWIRGTELVNMFRMLAGPIPEDPERNSVPKSKEVTEAKPQPSPKSSNPTKGKRRQLSLDL